MTSALFAYRITSLSTGFSRVVLIHGQKKARSSLAKQREAVIDYRRCEKLGYFVS